MIGCEINERSRLLHGMAPGKVIYSKSSNVNGGNYSTQFARENFQTQTTPVNHSSWSHVEYKVQGGRWSCFTISLNDSRFSIINLADVRRRELLDMSRENGHQAMQDEIVWSYSRNASRMTESWGQDHKFVFVGNDSGKRTYKLAHIGFGAIKSTLAGAIGELKINICSKGSNGVVGIKFVNVFSSIFLIQISHTQGQTVFRKRCSGLWWWSRSNVTAWNLLVEAK